MITAPHARRPTIPKSETKNWTLSLLDDFRQNVQDKGVFNAPQRRGGADRRLPHSRPRARHRAEHGEAGVPAGIDIGVFVTKGDVLV